LGKKGSTRNVGGVGSVKSLKLLRDAKKMGHYSWVLENSVLMSKGGERRWGVNTKERYLRPRGKKLSLCIEEGSGGGGEDHEYCPQLENEGKQLKKKGPRSRRK